MKKCCGGSQTPKPGVVSQRINRAAPRAGAPARIEWHGWARGVALHRIPADTGLGDTVARVVGTGERFKAWHEALFGLWEQPCDCDGKIAEWNTLYPYLPPT